MQFKDARFEHRERVLDAGQPDSERALVIAGELILLRLLPVLSGALQRCACVFPHRL